MNNYCMNEITTMHADLEQDLAAYRQAGFAAVELTLWKAEAYLQRHSLSELRQLVERSGLQPVSACSRNAEFQAFGKPADREASLRRMEADFKLMQQLGCTDAYIMGCNAPDNVTADSYRELAAHLRVLGDVAAKYGVKLALEFNYCQPIRSIRTVNRVLRETDHPHVGFVFDTCHFHKSPSKTEEISALRVADIFLVHVTDLEDVPIEIATDMNRVVPGEGIVPIREMIAPLARLGYRGPYSVEIFNRKLWEESPYAVAERVYRSLDRLFDDIH